MMAKVRTAARRARSRGSTWQRRAVDVAKRFGLHVQDVAPGAALVSRSGNYDIEPIVDKSSYVIGKRTTAGTTRLNTLKPGVLVCSSGPGADDTQIEALSPDAWLVSTAPVTSATSLVAETDALKHLGAGHVAWVLARYAVDVVLDVGAHTGEFARRLRAGGYEGHIVSFEPVPAFAEALTKHSANDDTWTIRQVALGESDGTMPLRVQRTFSSALPSSEYGRQRFATLRDFADTEQIEVPLQRLDSILDDILAPVIAAGTPQPRIFLKMDTQGFDLPVFRGLGARVSQLVGLQSEVALLLVYEGMPRMGEALQTYESAGFEISGLYPVTREPDGRVIEYDAVMVRASSLPD